MCWIFEPTQKVRSGGWKLLGPIMSVAPHSLLPALHSSPIQVQSQAGSPMKPKISSQNVGPRTAKSRVSEAAVLGQGAWDRETQLLWLPAESARTDILEALGLQRELISFEMWLEGPTSHMVTEIHVYEHASSFSYLPLAHTPSHIPPVCFLYQRTHFTLMLLKQHTHTPLPLVCLTLGCEEGLEGSQEIS